MFGASSSRKQDKGTPRNADSNAVITLINFLPRFRKGDVIVCVCTIQTKRLFFSCNVCHGNAFLSKTSFHPLKMNSLPSMPGPFSSIVAELEKVRRVLSMQCRLECRGPRYQGFDVESPRIRSRVHGDNVTEERAHAFLNMVGDKSAR